MGQYPVAKNHRELIAWRLCAALRRLVLTYTRRGEVSRDYRYRNDLRAAARSACYLTSEGYYRKRDGDFVNFLVWARASLGEAGDQIDDGHECGYFTTKQHQQMITMIKRACGANRGLREYLEAERERQKRRKRRRAKRPAKINARETREANKRQKQAEKDNQARRTSEDP